MKIFFTTVLLLVSSVAIWAQAPVKLTLTWNESSSRYEVYAISNVNQKNYALGASQISLVMPSSAPDVKLNIESSNGVEWVDSKFLTSPKGFESFDYHSVSTKGGVVNFVANEGLLLFSFMFADESCRDGVRLYNNNGDPGKADKSFNGLDFSNNLIGSGNVEIYSGNVANTGSKCGNCPVEFDLPVLKKKRS